MSSNIEIFRTRRQLCEWRASIDQGAAVAKKPVTIGFVPTMGALHAGHAQLLKQVRPRCDVSVLSIFVNPTQFGPNEDLAKYPRTFEADLEVARTHGVNVVFAPGPDEMYRAAHSTFVVESKIAGPLCGQFRPGHFRGVTTIVAKLFNLVRPQLALFGLKDAQQFFVLHQMAQDLDMAVSVEAIVTVREPDGLALSSRNAYLSQTNRQIAPKFFGILTATSNALKVGTPVATALETGRAALAASGFKVQYLDCVELPGFGTPHTILPEHAYLIAGAVYLGETRLIDNIIVNPAVLTRAGYKFS